MENEQTNETGGTPVVGFTKDEILYLINAINESTIKGIELPVAWSVWSKLVSLYKSM